jgi:hypothetical protein
MPIAMHFLKRHSQQYDLVWVLSSQFFNGHSSNFRLRLFFVMRLKLKRNVTLFKEILKIFLKNLYDICIYLH